MRQIPLTKGRIAIIDDEDFNLVSRFSWCAMSAGAQTRIGKKRILMHRLILDAPPGQCVDHINHDRLDNRRENLRLATSQENGWNRLKRAGGGCEYKGVIDSYAYRQGHPKNPRKPRFRAHISIHGTDTQLGRFDSAEDAARAYDDAARYHYGEFAYTNFPTEQELAARKTFKRRDLAEERERVWRPCRKNLPDGVGLRDLALASRHNFFLSK